jgi:PAS domain S-box-containing protein
MNQPLTTKPPSDGFDFLSGGGEMGRRIREHDWASTSLGLPQFWPQSLKTCIRIMLDSRQPIWIGWGKEWIKLYNDAYLSIIGGKHPWALGKPASEVWADIWEDIAPMLRQVEEGKGTYVESQLLIMERNGYPEETYYTFSYTPVLGDDGRIGGMFCANTDDTERIVSERQLRTLTQLGKALLDCRTADEVVSNTVQALSGNPQDFPFALIYDYRPEASVLLTHTHLGGQGGNIPRQIDFTVSNEITKAMKLAAATGRMQLVEGIREKLGDMPSGAWQLSADKAIILPITPSFSKEPYCFLVVGLNPHRLFDEQYSSFFSLIADQMTTAMSDVYAQEQERKRAEALAEIDRAKTAFFTNISHEFRTPLTLMLGTLEEALNDPNTIPQNLQRLDVTHRNAMRLLKLVNSLLDFSRIEASRVKAQFQRTDLAAYTTDLASSFRSAIEKAGLAFQVECDAGLPPVYVDREMWEKIVLNLLSNAFKYTLEGSITLSLKAEGEKVVLSVKDTGVGIPEAELPKMFQRFHRVQGVTGRTFEGTGIGLSLVKELVLLHGGEIGVQSTEGKGSEFRVAIPVNHAMASSELEDGDKEEVHNSFAQAFVEEAVSLLEQPALPTDEKRKKDLRTVLVVDDNADMRAYISNLLHQQFNVVTAIHGADALQKLEENNVDLVFSDVMMPVMDGIQLLKTIKEDAGTVALPVVLVSARAGEEARVEGLDTGADDYLVKPFSAKELIARVQSQINLAYKRTHALQSVYALFDEVPFAVAALKGPDLVIEYINQFNLDVWRRTKEEVFGKPLFEARPDIRAAAEGIHAEVYRTGQRFEAKEIPIELLHDGEPKLHYFDAIIDPMRDEQGNIIGQLATSIDVTDKVLTRKKIEESEAFNRTALESSPDCVKVLDSEGRLMFMNYNGQCLMEIDDFNVVKDKPWWELWGEENKCVVQKAVDKALKGEVAQFQALCPTAKGTSKWWDVMVSPIMGSDGKITQLISVSRDITASIESRIKTEESEARLRRTKEQLELSINAGQIGIWYWDVQADQLIWSREQYQIYGTTAEAFGGNHAAFQSFVLPEDMERLNADPALHFRRNTDQEYEFRIRRGDGKIRWISARSRVFYNDEGVLQYITGTNVDITPQKEAEEALRRSEERVRSYILQAPVAMGLYRGSELVVEIANEALLAFWGKPAEAVMNKPVFDAMPEARGQGYEELFAKVYRTGQRYAAYGSPVALPRNGVTQTLYVDIVYEPYREADGTISGVVEVVSDVTEKVLAAQKIQQSESRFQNLIHNAAVGVILLTGREMKVEVVNEAYGRLIDRTPDELLGQPLFNIIPEAEAQYRPILEQVMKSGEPLYLYDTPYSVQKDARTIEGFLHVTYQPYRNNDGVITGVLALLQDTTESVRAKKALEESEAKFRSVIENAPAAIGLFVGRNLVIESPNQTFVDIVGKGWGIVGKPLREAMPELITEGQPYLQILDDVFTTGKAFSTPGSLVKIVQQGVLTSRYYSFTYSPLYNADGKVWAILDIAIDVTEQIEAQQAITESEKQFRDFSNNIQNLAWIADGEGWIYWYNQRWYDYTGTTLEEMQGWGWEKVHHPDHIERVVAFVKEAWSKPQPWELTFPLRGADGVYRWFLTRAVPVLDDEGKITRWIGTNTNIHEQKMAQQAIAESEARFRTLANDTPAFLFTADADTNLSFVNRQWLEFVGLEEKEGFGKSWERVTHPDDIGPMYAIYLDAVANKKSYHFEIRQKNIAGEYRWILWNGIPRLDANGDLLGIVGIGIDVTEQKRVQELVQASEARFRQMADLVPQILWTARPDGSVDYYNKRWYQYTGVAEDSGNEEWTPFIHPDDQTQMISVWTESIQTGKAYQFEFRLKEAATGHYRWFMAKAVPVRDEAGRLVKWFGATYDIHEQKLIEEILKENEARFRSLANAMPQVVWVAESNGEVMYYNDQVVQFEGAYQLADGNWAWQGMMHPEDVEATAQAWNDAIASGSVYEMEHRIKIRGDGYRWFLSRAIPQVDETGQVQKWYGTATDIHDQKTFMEKLEEEVAQRTKDLQRSNEDLQQFAHVASHDLKEPVRKVRTFSNRLRDEFGTGLPDKANTYLEKIESAASRMYAMIDGVLAYSSLGGIEQVREEVDLNKTIAQIQNDLEVVISGKGATLQYGRLPVVSGYALLLYQLFYNLMNNSLKFSKAGVPPLITIAAQSPLPGELKANGLSEGNWVRISITDNGIGFSPAYRHRIFQTFSRLNSKDKFEGTGLGLALCKKIVERHGGAIWAEGEEGKGAEFVMILPA